MNKYLLSSIALLSCPLLFSQILSVNAGSSVSIDSGTSITLDGPSAILFNSHIQHIN